VREGEAQHVERAEGPRLEGAVEGVGEGREPAGGVLVGGPLERRPAGGIDRDHAVARERTRHQRDPAGGTGQGRRIVRARNLAPLGQVREHRRAALGPPAPVEEHAARAQAVRQGGFLDGRRLVGGGVRLRLAPHAERDGEDRERAGERRGAEGDAGVGHQAPPVSPATSAA
jgi:hypothetical protein